MHKNPWQRLSSAVIHKNKWYKIRQDKVIKPNGHTGDYFVIDHPASVYCVVLNEKEELLLVGLYRYPTDVYSWELPAGGVDEGEDIMVAAKRELQEESGMTTGSLVEAGKFQAYNGACNEFGYVFIIRDWQKVSENEQAEEGIDDTCWVSFAQAFAMMKTGEISDGQSIAAIMQAALFLEIIKA